MKKIAVLVSGNGSNLQSLIDSCSEDYIPGKIALVISSRPGAYALKRAEEASIDTLVLQRGDLSRSEYSDLILNHLKNKKIDIVCLAGFMQRLGKNLTDFYRGRIINIHPALLPKFGGKGMYGIKVHREVISSGEKVSGCTVHHVDQFYDHGQIIKKKEVPVKKNDTPRSLSERVLESEHQLYPRVLKELILNLEKKEFIKND